MLYVKIKYQRNYLNLSLQKNIHQSQMSKKNPSNKFINIKKQFYNLFKYVSKKDHITIVWQIDSNFQSFFRATRGKSREKSKHHEWNPRIARKISLWLESVIKYLSLSRLKRRIVSPVHQKGLSTRIDTWIGLYSRKNQKLSYKVCVRHRWSRVLHAFRRSW